MPERKPRPLGSQAALARAATPEGRFHLLWMWLRLMTDAEAREKCTAARREWVKTPEGQANIAMIQSAAKAPESRAKRVITLKAFAQTPDGAAALAALHSPENRAKRSAAIRERNKDPEVKARKCAAMKRWATSPEGSAALARIRAIRAAKRQERLVGK